MTYWEHLVANSTLAEAEGDVWEHLLNPNGEGGGGGEIFFGSDVVIIEEENAILLAEVNDTVVFIEQATDDVIVIFEVEDTELIQIEEQIDVI